MSEQKRLDRPELREILEDGIEWDGRKILIDNFEEVYAKILALIPDIEEELRTENTKLRRLLVRYKAWNKDRYD